MHQQRSHEQHVSATCRQADALDSAATGVNLLFVQLPFRMRSGNDSEGPLRSGTTIQMNAKREHFFLDCGRRLNLNQPGREGPAFESARVDSPLNWTGRLDCDTITA
jgi:hypothetical protein